MRKIFFAVFLSASLLFLGASCFKSSSNTNSAPIAISNVNIQNFAFNPQVVTIANGAMVTWKNFDSTGHQIITDGDLPALQSGIIDQNEDFNFTFDQTGTWKYHCNIHPSMTGTVIVK
jgi:plastocyanin